MEKVLYFDCDGVIAYFESLRLDFVRRKHPKLKETKHYGFDQYGFSDKEIIDFVSGKEYSQMLRNMNPIKGAVEGLNFLFEEVDESNILTFRNSYEGIDMDTRNWFEKVKGKYHNLFFEQFKSRFIQNYKKGILIEDSPYNIQMANAVGIPCICVPWSYNTEIQERKDNPLLRVRSWINDGSRKSNLVECIRDEFDWKEMKFGD